MTPTLAQVVRLLDTLFPPGLAEPWDAVGLVAGDPGAPVGKVAFAVDPVRRALDEAISWGADLLVVHHPLFLRPVHSVAATTFKGALIHRLISSHCALYTAHTNADAAHGGVADALGEAIGVHQMTPLVPCADDATQGIGRVGRLEQPTTLTSLAMTVADALPRTEHGIRIAGDGDAVVQRIAIVGGAGDSLFDDVRAAQADVYITADLRHHPASEQRERAEFDGGGRPYLLDISHSASEWHWLERAGSRLVKWAAERGTRVETYVIPTVADPWTARIATDRPRRRP